MYLVKGRANFILKSEMLTAFLFKVRSKNKCLPSLLPLNAVGLIRATRKRNEQNKD